MGRIVGCTCTRLWSCTCAGECGCVLREKVLGYETGCPLFHAPIPVLLGKGGSMSRDKGYGCGHRALSPKERGGGRLADSCPQGCVSTADNRRRRGGYPPLDPPPRTQFSWSGKMKLTKGRIDVGCCWSTHFCVPDPLTPHVTFRWVFVPLRGPGQSPVRPFACCVGALRSVGRCGRCSCWCCFRVRGAQSLVCWGCAECGMVCRLCVSGAQ